MEVSSAPSLILVPWLHTYFTELFFLESLCFQQNFFSAFNFKPIFIPAQRYLFQWFKGNCNFHIFQNYSVFVYNFFPNSETFWLTSWCASFWCSEFTWEGIGLPASLDLSTDLSKLPKTFLKKSSCSSWLLYSFMEIWVLHKLCMFYALKVVHL